MTGKRIRTQAQLDREIYRYKLRVKGLEHEFDKQAEHLRHHFPSMLLRTLLGRSKPMSLAAITGSVALRLMEDKQMQDGLLSFLGKLSARVGRMFRRGHHETDDQDTASPSNPTA